MSREHEIAAACSALVPEDSEQAPKIVLISGVPGVGKSRLTHEILEQFGTAYSAYIGQCASRGTAPALGPIHDILKQTGVQPTQAHSDKDDIQSDPFAAAHTARMVARDQLRALHATTKAIMVIEDAHWIDAATSDLIASLTTNPIPMIITCRTMFDAPWVQADSVLRIDLNPLQPSDIQRIVEAHLAQPISQGLADLIWTKSEGIPLVAEEIARALAQNSDLISGPNGLELPKGNDLQVTGNLEQMIMARVDALPPAQRTALQVASAIGREFSQSVLSQVLGQPCDASLIQKMGGLIVGAGPNLWRFSHALVQDAVYGSQLTAQRRTIHLKIAQTLEASSNTNGSNSNLLAEHYVKAKIPAKAVQYLLESAHEDLALYALAQVDQSLEQAMGFVEADPDVVAHETLGDLALVWLRALDQSGAFAKVLVAADRLLPLLDARPYLPHRSVAKTLTAIAMAHSRDYKSGEILAQSTLTEAVAEGDEWGAAWAKVALMRIYEETHWSSPEETEKLADEIAPVALATNDKHLAMTAQYLRSSLYRSTGRRLKALDIAGELSDFAQTHHDRRAQSYALWAQALVYGIEGNPEAALETIAPGRKDAVQGAADTIIFDMIALYSQVFLVPYTDMRTKLDQFHAQVEELGDFNMIHAITWVISLSQFMAGRLAEGWETLHKLINDEKAAANVNMLRQALMSRAEIQLVLNGLIDPAAEAPASRPTLPREKPGFADFAKFAEVRLRGLRQASADYHALIDTDRLKHGNIYARAQIGLGLIALRRGQKGAASQYLNDGLAAAQDEKLGQLVTRAKTALRKLA